AFGGLSCGETHVIAVDALDAAGSRSGATSISGSTEGCPDTSAPTAPMFLIVSRTSATTISVTWLASVDNVGVTGYGVAINGAEAANVDGPLLAYTFAGLQCGTGYTLSVTASDAVGNVSPAATITG